MNELISVIVPVYNAEKYLRECVDSILNQTYKNFEVILVDDGSTDGSPAICDEYAKTDERVKVIRKENGGVSSARNLGLEVANGEYICFIDSDDFVSEDYLKNLYNSITENNSDMAFCKFARYVNGKVVSNKDIDALLTIDSDKKRVELIKQLLLIKNNLYCGCWRILFAQSIVSEIRFDKEIKVCEDLLFVLSAIVKSKKFSFVNKELYFYRANETSVTRNYKKNYLNNQLALCNAIKDLLSNFENKYLERIFCNFCANILCWTIVNELKYKQPNRRNNIQEIKNSTLYVFFKLKYGIYRGNTIKGNIKFLIVWFLIKFRLV